MTPPGRVGFVDLLLGWADGAGRDLPWRRTRDPWAILVSELMLQQTQVARVIPRYAAFLARFPDPAAAAAASAGELISEWAGLGYNRRAVHLHATACRVVAEHGGQLPDDLDALLRLPGIGPYTARAILVFAFERTAGVVDTNAARVLARAVAGRPLGAREVQRLADATVPADRSWVYNQAMLDLGATTCTARRPACGRCPVMSECRWAALGWSAPDPVIGTAGVTGTQSRFDGSDRQGRGRLVSALRSGPVAARSVPDVAGWPQNPERAWRVAASLVTDGLAEIGDDGSLVLP